jgi:hypothetical protein
MDSMYRCLEKAIVTTVSMVLRLDGLTHATIDSVSLRWLVDRQVALATGEMWLHRSLSGTLYRSWNLHPTLQARNIEKTILTNIGASMQQLRRSSKRSRLNWSGDALGKQGDMLK